MKIAAYFKNFDWALVLPAVGLTLLGLLSIYSSSVGRADFASFKKQALFFGFSIIVLGLVSLIDLRPLKANSYLAFFLYFFSLVLLTGVLFLGPKIRGIRGWYKVGPLSFDPAFFAALALIIVLAKYFSKRHIELKRFQPILFSAFYGFWPVLLIFFQPDMGSALTVIAVWLGMVIFSGIRLRHLLVLFLIFSILFIFAWHFVFRDYQRQRILSFFNPQIDKQGISWSANQSKIALGSGGFWGKGLGKGSQTQLGFLPEPKTDFIFSALGEEFGFLGLFLLLFFLLGLLWRVLKITFLASDNFSRLLATGFACLVLSQSFINIGMCLGLFPVVGIPLPFVSYGGSQLLAFYFGLGLLASLTKRG